MGQLCNRRIKSPGLAIYTHAMKAIAAVVLVLSCAAGMAAFVIGRLAGWPVVEEVGAWLTAPLWLVLGGLALVAAIGQPLAAALRLAQRWRGRRPR